MWFEAFLVDVRLGPGEGAGVLVTASTKASMCFLSSTTPLAVNRRRSGTAGAEEPKPLDIAGEIRSGWVPIDADRDPVS
jgi:hypothetical protein